MKVYVAGALADAPRVAALIGACRRLGHEITLDWTTLDIDEDEGGRPSHAAAMLEAVSACDVLVFVDHVAARGALVELGAALAGDKDAVVCAAVQDSVFFALPRVRQVPDDDVVMRAFAAPDLEGFLERLQVQAGPG